MLRLTFKCNAVTDEHRNDSMTSLLAYTPIKMAREILVVVVRVTVYSLIRTANRLEPILRKASDVAEGAALWRNPVHHCRAGDKF